MDTKARREVEGVELWSGCWAYTSELGGEAGVIREEAREKSTGSHVERVLFGPFPGDKEVFV